MLSEKDRRGCKPFLNLGLRINLCITFKVGDVFCSFISHLFESEHRLTISSEYSKFDGLPPLASLIDNIPIGVASNPVSIPPDTEASILSKYFPPHCIFIKRILKSSVPTRGSSGGRVGGRKGHSAAMMFLGHSDEINTTRRSVGDRGFNANRTIAGKNPVEDTIELNEKNEKNEKKKIKRKSGEIQARADPITTEPLAKKLGTSTTVSEELPQINTGKLEFHLVPISGISLTVYS